MAETSLTLQDLLHKAGIDQTQFLQDSLAWLLQQLMEADVSTQIRADRHERTADRTTRRNGYRERACLHETLSDLSATPGDPPD